MKVASSIVIGQQATASLVTKAIEATLKKADLTSASSVMLLLTPDFAKDLQVNIQVAAVAAQTTQIIGCMAPCIFTEQDWVTDAAGVAVMVFDDQLQWVKPEHQHLEQPILTIAAPHALNTSWMTQTGQRFGAVAGDATGFGSYTVWQNGKGVPESYVQKVLLGVDVSLRNLEQLQPEHVDFGLLFSPISDLLLEEKSATRLARPIINEKLIRIKAIYGQLPLIGFLGNGQIVPSNEINKPCMIHSNMSLLALCKAS